MTDTPVLSDERIAALEALARKAIVFHEGDFTEWHEADDVAQAVSTECAEFIAACDPQTILALCALLRGTSEDTRRLDWLDAQIGKDQGMIVQSWTHDGRRLITKDRDGWPCLLVHKFADRGGADEDVRAAIDAARSATHQESPT